MAETGEKMENNHTDELIKMLIPESKMDKKIADLLSPLGNNFTGLVLMESDKYNLVRGGVMRWLFEVKKIPGVYITTNSAFKELKNTLTDNKIDYSKARFIDSISRMSNIKEVETKICEYVDAPTALTEIMLALEKEASSLKGDKKFLVLDSVSTLLVYNDEESIKKFVHSLIGKTKELEMMCILIMVKSTEYKGVINTIGQFCDKTMELR